MYLDRQLCAAFTRARRGFPAVLITGPRQSGKTTFLRHHAAEVPYVTFDDPLERAFARDDPNGLLDRFDGPVVLDEIQHVPELLPYLKMRMDADRRPGRFLLTGSQQFELMRGVTESLAGRVAILELLPLSEFELPARDLETAIWLGGYPDVALMKSDRELWLSSYLRTYVERDVRQVRDIQDLRTFEQFLALSATRHGQEHHPAALSRACGVSQPTVKSWTSVLAASYIVALLPPWHSNLGKRLIKSPKQYLLDPALVCALTRQPSGEAALAGPMGGALMEGMIVVETLKAFAAHGRPPAYWFWRSHDGLEVDLILDVGDRIIPIEVKLTATPLPRHTRPLSRLRALIGDRCDPGLLLCRTREPKNLPGGVKALPWQHWPRRLDALLTATPPRA